MSILLPEMDIHQMTGWELLPPVVQTRVFRLACDRMKPIMRYMCSIGFQPHKTIPQVSGC